MTFRERMRRAFRRPVPKDDGKPKIEYYRRGEVPRSKYRGPVDPEHRRKLNAWNFQTAMINRRRSIDLDLSPCSSIPEDGRWLRMAEAHEEEVVVAPDFQLDVVQTQPSAGHEEEPITVMHHEIAPSRSVDTVSQSSTAVGTNSFVSSSPTLRESCDFPRSIRKPMVQWKEKLRYTPPLTRRISAPEKRMPVAPTELTRALNAIQIC